MEIKGSPFFKPDEIRSDTVPPIPEIGSFQVSYRKIDPLEKIEGKVILLKSISEIKHIELSFNQNTFSFELLGLQFTDPLKNQFRYKLQGYDQNWIYSREGEHYANYANVTPGKYTFEFFAANSNGIWSQLPKSIGITVNPPFWFTWYAYVFYAIVTILIFVYSLRINKKIVTLKHNVRIEKLEAQKNQELTEAKVTFFMNVSHEFKTPITLILGPLQLLLNHFSKDKIAKSYLSVIKNQADYLHNLLEQLVYFRKAESAILELKCQYLDIIQFLENLIGTYQWQAEEQRIEIRFIHPDKNVFLWFDPKKMEKVFHNLISNALKYTNPGGNINLLLNYDENENIIIKIKDNGKGISEDHIDHIFDRFYQVDSTAGGYGIGLSLTKSLIDLHKGNISVKSAQGKGTEFSILLRADTEHLTDKQMITEDISQEFGTINTQETQADVQLNNVKTSKASEADQKEVLLIVEDNLRMLSFIEKSLSGDYRIMTAKNGREALELIDMNLPDLIISDVMMSEMDGITFLKKIKEDMITCHIPVILLTAKSEVEHRIEGLEQGADHYVSKPFDVNLLKAEVKGIIQNRNKIKERIKKNLPFDLTKENIHPLDIKLLEIIQQIVSENYTNPDFDSNLFSKKTYMNRSQFFKKMKALTNQTPTEYIREYRMNKAVEFLLKEKIPVSEVNYKVGISSRSYFTKCFKELYGTSPGEFLKKKDLVKN
ncbi:ATP-binding protein [Bacteroidota bacterium]